LGQVKKEKCLSELCPPPSSRPAYAVHFAIATTITNTTQETGSGAKNNKSDNCLNKEKTCRVKRTMEITNKMHYVD
jgi:hypothetical protein